MTNTRRTTESDSRAGENPNPLAPKRVGGREGEVPPSIGDIDPANLPPGATITETEAGTELRFSSTEAENQKVERKRQAGLEAQQKARLDQIQNPPAPPVEEIPPPEARERE
jgi:hypothetical protein